MNTSTAVSDPVLVSGRVVPDIVLPTTLDYGDYQSGLLEQVFLSLCEDFPARRTRLFPEHEKGEVTLDFVLFRSFGLIGHVEVTSLIQQSGFDYVTMREYLSFLSCHASISENSPVVPVGLFLDFPDSRYVPCSKPRTRLSRHSSALIPVSSDFYWSPRTCFLAIQRV